MGSNTNFDPTGEKRARKQATLKGAIYCGVINVGLGAFLAFLVLAGTAPDVYDSKPDSKTGKTSPPPSGLYYWPGAPGGSYQVAEAQYLADKPGSVTLADGDLNAWSAVVFKSDIAAPKPKVAAKPAAPKTTAPVSKTKEELAKAEDKLKAAETTLKTFGVDAGTPNFHVFHDPQAPADVPLSFQIAVPMVITVFGQPLPTVYQIRGVFVAGPNGPQFKSYHSFLGNARIPVAPGLAQLMLNSFVAKYAGSDAAKKYADAWVKYASATEQDGALVLAGK